MDAASARQIIEMDNLFYRVHASSFSRTRERGWDGWSKAWDIARAELGLRPFSAPAANEPDSFAVVSEPAGCSVFDLACGNLRFEKALVQTAPHIRFCFDALDCCDELAADTGYVDTDMSRLSYRSADILGCLLKDEYLPVGSTGDSPHDLSACFGFMHHVPGAELRGRVLQTLLDATRPGGIVVVSFWQFMNDERLARKASALTDAVRAGEFCCGLGISQLEEGDYFLDWQSDTSVLRYCHHTTDREIDQLLAGLDGVHEVERYSADGRNNNLNRYVILKRN